MTIAHITPIRGVNDDNLGKKHALSKLIHATTADYVWLHDDDVVWPKAVNNCQLSIVNCQFDLIILPLKMESEHSSPSLLESLQIAEYAAIQEITMAYAKAGRAVMCSGANLIVRRDVWLACEAELHPEIPSGDDMFLLEAVKRHGYKIGVIDEPDYTAIVRPHTSLRALFLQRTRWAGKAPHYTDQDILRCGRLVVLANSIQFFFLPFLLIKYPIEYALILKREPQTRWFVALLLELIYPYYMLACLFGGLFRRNNW
ncbi:MAG: glycosyltransferase [Paludibacteraceae bacterium]|nr:glycosyltransferase [Paludibacteraceae bacterium]